MPVIHQLTGYDKITERVAMEVPVGNIERAYSMAGVDTKEPEAFGGCYPVSWRTACEIAGAMLPEFDWFLECYQT